MEDLQRGNEREGFEGFNLFRVDIGVCKCYSI